MFPLGFLYLRPYCFNRVSFKVKVKMKETEEEVASPEVEAPLQSGKGQADMAMRKELDQLKKHNAFLESEL